MIACWWLRAGSRRMPTSSGWKSAGVNAILVGESLTREADIGAAVDRLLGNKKRIEQEITEGAETIIRRPLLPRSLLSYVFAASAERAVSAVSAEWEIGQFEGVTQRTSVLRLLAVGRKHMRAR